MTGVAFRPDGARLAGVGGDRTGRVWDAATGREVVAFRSPSAPPAGPAFAGVAFAPDGRWLRPRARTGSSA